MQWAETTAPKSEVDGAVQAARSLGVKVILVGQEDAVRRELEQHDGWRDLPIEVVHASERITMEDSAARAVRTKRDSSMRVASRLVRDGVAQGFVSAGNTGAVMATAKMVQGVVPRRRPPGAGAGFPDRWPGTPVVVVDVGANVDCSAAHAGAVRGHGRHLFAGHPAPQEAPGRPALDRRRRA